MNELNKLLGSLLLLGGGFLAASLVGPPELADRLSRLLKPTEVADAQGLRPLPATASTNAWPQTPPSTPGAAGSSYTAAASPSPTAPAFQSPTQQPITRATPTAWPNSPGDFSSPPVAPQAPGDDWLAGESFDFGSSFNTPPANEARPPSPATTAPTRPLTPVARRQAPSAPAPSIQSPETATGWPELRAPLPPRLEETAFDQHPENPSRDRTPTSLESNPYGSRPSFGAMGEALTREAVAPANPLRFEQRGFGAEPVARTPIAKRYERHVVTDGDTLASLASRYLGDAGRARELYELNRDRLEHPDVLPIGMVLKTPDTRNERRNGPPAATRIDAFPSMPPGSAFSTVAATENPVREFARDVVQGLQRPMTSVDDAPQQRRLTDSERLGPIDPLYNHEVSWDAAGW